MIVVGVDVHKQSLTAVAVDEAGRALAELRASSGRELLAWVDSLESERLWALEDCRQLTRARIAITQARLHPPARAYLERKQAEGKSRREALRCLKRQLARTIFNTLKARPTLT